MYWLLNDKNLLKRNHVEQETEGHFQDLFMNKVEGNDNLLGFNSNWNRENLFYLHGGIHLLSKNMDAFKVTRGNSVMKLAEIRRELLENDELVQYDNCIIFNASSDEKLDDIYRNNYLIKAFGKLLSCNGDMVIYGCTEPTETNQATIDTHIWRNIVNSKLSNIYVGVESQEAINRKANELANYLRRFKQNTHRLSVHCFSFNTHNIWKEKQFFEEIRNGSSKPSSI